MTGFMANAAQRMVDAFNARSIEEVADLVHPHVVDHHLPRGFPAGIEGIRQWWGTLHDAFDLHVDLVDVIEGVDRAATRLTVYASQVGPFLGHSSTGRACVVTFLSIERFDSGRVIERWQMGDTLHASLRLGAVSLVTSDSR